MIRTNSALPTDENRSTRRFDGSQLESDSFSMSPGYEERWSPPNNWYLNVRPSATRPAAARDHCALIAVSLIVGAAVFGYLVWHYAFSPPPTEVNPTARIGASERPLERMPLVNRRDAMQPSSVVPPGDGKPSRSGKAMNDQKALLMLFFQSLRQGRGAL